MNVIQLRSDTRTVPIHQMRQSICSSSYGDWTYKEDSTVKELQSYTAALFGKEDAAYVISGVFGNQVSILTATHPGSQVIVREKAHIIKYQNGSCGLISRVMTKPLQSPKGYITAEEVRKVIRKKKDSQAPHTAALLLQFPTFEGLVPPLEDFNECCRIAKEQGIHVHVDGARVFNGLAAAKITPAQLVKNVSSLTFCLSKGLCAPMGSLVVGDKQFISRLKANRKMLGGVIRKPGVVAGAALIAMKKMTGLIGKDNQIAKILSQRLVGLGWIELAVPVQTNMIFFRITSPLVKASELEKFMGSQGIIAEFVDNGINRFVSHHYIREEEVEKIIAALKQYYESVQNTIS